MVFLCPPVGNCQRVGLGMKRTKKITQAIKAIASGMPKQEYQYLKTQEEKGEVLIKRGITETSDKKAIDPDKVYVKKVPVNNPVNHINRMKSAFDADGVRGLKNYLKPFIKVELQTEFFLKVDRLLS